MKKIFVYTRGNDRYTPETLKYSDHGVFMIIHPNIEHKEINIFVPFENIDNIEEFEPEERIEV